MNSLFALFIVALIPSICKGLHENDCDVVPKDPYIEAGSSIAIVCLTSCVSSKIYWTLDNMPINESLSNTVNRTHTVLSLRSFTHHSATLQCHDAVTQQVIGGTTIRTYSKPSNISCMFYYTWGARGAPNTFSCNWTHQIDSSLKINYTVLCDKCSTKREICYSHETTCKSQDLLVVNELFIKSYGITVRATSAAWKDISSSYEFNSQKILKTDSPELTVNTFSNHLLVGWTIPTRTSTKYYCQLKYGKANNEDIFERINKTLEIWEKGEEKISNDKLESCSNYTFAVRCTFGDALWSNWNQKTVLIKLKKSDVKLDLWRKVAEAENSGVRKVHVLWTDIPSTCQDTFTPIVYKEDIAGVNYTLCRNPFCDVNQDAQRINLTIFHNETVFAEDSVYVPAVGESLPQVRNINTSSSNGDILVTWNAPVQPVIGYMIDYTPDGRRYYWKKTNNTYATLSGLQEKKQYNITVTPLFDDKTGHGTDAPPTCSTQGDPGNVTIISVQARHKSANVSWNVKSVEACSGVVVSYTVVYSKQMEPQRNVTINSEKQYMLLEDLSPDTQYDVYVEATALTGTSKSSNWVFNTKTFDPGLIIGLSVSGSILIIVVLSLGLCCAIQWKKFKEKPVPNPKESSVALWPKQEKGICTFSNPSESFDRVYPEESRRTSTSSSAISCNHNPASDQTEVYAYPPMVLPQNVQKEDQAEIQHPSPPGESTALISFENSPSSPYQSQSPVETLSPKISKDVPAKQQEKTIYVTLDMFEHAQAR